MTAPMRVSLTDVAVDKRAKDGARPRRALLLIRLQLSFGASQQQGSVQQDVMQRHQSD